MVYSLNDIFGKKNPLLTMIDVLLHYCLTIAYFLFYDILSAHDEYASANAS